MEFEGVPEFVFAPWSAFTAVVTVVVVAVEVDAVDNVAADADDEEDSCCNSLMESNVFEVGRGSEEVAAVLEEEPDSAVEIL